MSVTAEQQQGRLGDNSAGALVALKEKVSNILAVTPLVKVKNATEFFGNVTFKNTVGTQLFGDCMYVATGHAYRAKPSRP